MTVFFNDSDRESGGTTTVTPGPHGGKIVTWTGNGYKEHLKMTDQLSRDDLLTQRLWAATNDLSGLLKEMAALVDNPPPAGADQEERMRGIEGSIDSIRWGCKKLREYKA